MSDTVIEISGVRVVQRDDKHEDAPRREKEKRREEQKKDCIDISTEARERASGKKRGNILEFLEEI